MRFVIIGVGRLRERYFREAADAYIKRLSRYGGVDEIELPDLPEPKGGGEADTRRVIDAEGAGILKAIRPGDYVVALCVEGRQMPSEALASHIARLETGGVARMVFCIGGSLGLSAAVRARAQEHLSLSAMTFPHQLARVVLLEQVYRACKINANERYHK